MPDTKSSSSGKEARKRRCSDISSRSCSSRARKPSAVIGHLNVSLADCACQLSRSHTILGPGIFCPTFPVFVLKVFRVRRITDGHKDRIAAEVLALLE